MAAPRRRSPAWAAQLADGRWLVSRRAPGRGPAFLFALALILVAIAVGTYPVVRRLTQRLERLQRGVDALGAGELAARVKVEGRDEVARLAESFNRAAARIEKLVGAHKSLLANTSHELRTPLARIRMALELGKDRGARSSAISPSSTRSSRKCCSPAASTPCLPWKGPKRSTCSRSRRRRRRATTSRPRATP